MGHSVKQRSVQDQASIMAFKPASITATFALAGIVLALTGFSSSAMAASMNHYQSVLTNFLGMEPAAALEWGSTIAAFLSFVILTLFGLAYKSAVTAAGDNVVPEGGISIRNVVEGILDFVAGLAEDVIGKPFRKFLPLLVATFFFILISNLMGMIPGMVPTTESINTNLALGLAVFFYYTWAGIQEHGASYIKQFTGPVWWLIPLMLLIEVVAHLARPLSLSLRLLGNIFGDHLVLSVFNDLSYGIVAPALFSFFGLMVACLQSFIFTLLSSIYISLAISHDH